MLSVLVIDDQKSLLEVIRPLLERFGNMNVKTAVSAKEALDLLTSNTYDAMVVDYDLPEINGIEFLKDGKGKRKYHPLDHLYRCWPGICRNRSAELRCRFFLKER